MTVSDGATQGTQSGRLSRHISFLAYDNFRYLKRALAAVVAALVLYIAVTPNGPRYGGGWAGYTLGTIGALLILWLAWFGYRKRNYAPRRKYVSRPGTVAAEALHPPEDPGRLARWLSAHVYLGLALLVIATLHTGFHFGWNVHTV
jgi:O-antigen/teichoic acid export membrane protein